MHDPLSEAVSRAAEYGGGSDEVWLVPLDRATVLLGSPGIYDGLTIAVWQASK